MDPAEQQRASGRGWYWLAAMALLLGLTALFHAATRGERQLRSLQSDDGSALVTLERHRDGHFYAQGLINGHAVGFLVDTGATDIAVSSSVARALGLDFGPQISVMTAAGRVPAWLTRLDRVAIGPLELRNVRATITDGLGDRALLGQSFLRNFSIVQQGDRLDIAVPGATGI